MEFLISQHLLLTLIHPNNNFIYKKNNIINLEFNTIQQRKKKSPKKHHTEPARTNP